jgi:hypothetical protein
MEQAVVTTKIPLMHFIAFWEVERSWRNAAKQIT